MREDDIPLMPNQDFEDRVKSHINGTPQEKQSLTVSGVSGFKCSWESMGKRHRGIFLDEKMGGGMSVIHFVDCQAPAGNFTQYKDVFEKIIDSVKK